MRRRLVPIAGPLLTLVVALCAAAQEATDEPPPALPCTPLLDQRLDAGFLTPADRGELLDALVAAGPASCAQPLLERARETASLDVIRLIDPAFEAWGDPGYLPDLYGLYGESMLSPFGRKDDMALSTARAIRSLRAVGGEPLVQLEWTEVRAEWLGLAHDRFVAEWGMGALDATPPTPQERRSYIELAGPGFEQCLTDPSKAPRDPFDPLLRSSTASSELSASTRCAAVAILDTWVEHGTPAWSENITRLLGHYPNMDYWGPLGLELEERWDQQVLPPAAASMGDRERWAVAGGGLGPWPYVACGILVLLLVLGVWKADPRRVRAVALRCGAVVVGLGAIVGVELVLVVAGLAPGDELRPQEACSLDEFPLDAESVVVMDKRNRGFALPKPEGQFRVAVVGASTVAGPGLPFEETIPGALQGLLGDEVEVMALGIYGIDSPWIRSWAIYAVDHLEADLVVVYTGHNEVGVTREQVYTHGLGPPAWWLRAQGRARRTRLAGVLVPLFGKDGPPAAATDESEDGNVVADSHAHEDHAIDLSTHHRGFERRVTAGFEVEITDMVRAVHRRGAQVLIVQPSFNHHGLRVPSAVSATDADRAARGNDLALEIEKDLRAGYFDSVLAKTEQLVRLVPDHATPHLLHGLAAENMGQLDVAEAAIWQASRLNHGGSAVTPGVASAIPRIARRHDVPLADAHAALHEASPDHLPGFGMYWDFVHFNAAGTAVVAAEIARVMEGEGLLE